MNLFVYGTLAPGEPNEYVLKDVEGTWLPGTVKGQLFESGWGAAMGYPGIVLDDNGANVSGLLFSAPNLADHLARLDEFEGEGYQRVMTTVYLDNGDTAQAYIYELSGSGRP